MWLAEFSSESLRWIPLLAAAMVGLCVGSFLSVVVYRLPIILLAQWEGRPAPLNLAFPKSHCPSCGHGLRWWENVPLLSYFFVLKGRCSNCGVKIPAVYPCMEAITSALSVVTVWRFGMNWSVICALVLLWCLIVLIWIDAREQFLPDVITIPLLWLGLLVNLSGTFVELSQAVLGAVLGYLSLWSIYLIFKIFTGKDGLGYGDFKLMAALGAWLGWMAVPWIVFGASTFSALYGLTLGFIKKERFNRTIAFGPFLAATGWVVFLFCRDFVAIK